MRAIYTFSLSRLTTQSPNFGPKIWAASAQTNANEKSQSSSSNNSARDAGIGITRSEWDLSSLTGVDVTQSPPEQRSRSSGYRPEKEESQKQQSGSKPFKPKLTCPESGKPPPKVCCVCGLYNDGDDVFALCGMCKQYSCPRHTRTAYIKGGAKIGECRDCMDWRVYQGF